ncbi:hypothetical protein [Hoeflea sp.]|uniref:hypothetical protein n=1 Tax=Hoeflea sp. TaxID=1940281 RepID=UPI00199CF522|nr:hypothetical protein [Hoeflea sp.]MBC7285383.1 hypothetical protein [Hoeflea sp.]
MHAAQLIGDKAYDARGILDHAVAIGARLVIPQRSCMNRPRTFYPAIDKHRDPPTQGGPRRMDTWKQRSSQTPIYEVA